jgi:DNA end-binding protein Ku
MPEEAGRKPYALLVKAMEESSYLGVAKVTMHNREYTVLLRPHKGGVMLHTMYYQNEIREVEGFGKVDVEPKAAEVKIANQLIDALAAEWDPEKYHDQFQENLKKLIKAHMEGKEVPEVEKPKKIAPVVDLMDALKKSLAATEGKPAKKGPQRAAAHEGARHAKRKGKKAA